MNIASTETHQSKSIEGVTFTLRRVGPALKSRVNVEIAETRGKLQDLSRQLEGFEKQMQDLLNASEKDEKGVPLATNDTATATPAMWAVADKILRVRDQMKDLTRSEVAPVQFKAAVISIGGKDSEGKPILQVDGKPITPQQICDYGPDELFGEIFEALSNQFYLPESVGKNSQSPTTSSQPEDGTATSTVKDGSGTSGTVDAASESNSTSSETAGSITPSLQNAA